MNWKLIFQLSLFGLAMAVATVYWIPSQPEWIFWVVIFIFCAYRISKIATGKFFLHGFLVSILNSFWITLIHIALFQTYMSHHPEEVSMMNQIPMPDKPRLMMLLMGPIIGAVSGLVLGLFSFIASKLKRETTTAG
jgi:hypothetical protein